MATQPHTTLHLAPITSTVELVGYAPVGQVFYPRTLEVTWNAERKQWELPCGCAIHPDDDNNTHGGAPHFHREHCKEGHTE